MEELKPCGEYKEYKPKKYPHYELFENSEWISLVFTPFAWGIGIDLGYDYNWGITITLGPVYFCLEIP